MTQGPAFSGRVPFLNARRPALVLHSLFFSFFSQQAKHMQKKAPTKATGILHSCNNGVAAQQTLRHQLDD